MDAPARVIIKAPSYILVTTIFNPFKPNGISFSYQWDPICDRQTK